MSIPPNPTLSFYAREAATYAARERFAPGRSRGADDYARRMDAFLSTLSPGGSVLELGCGAGADTLAMRARGFTVRPTDGSPEMAAEAAARLGHPVDTLLFTDLTNDPADVAAYNGVWASACLLHCPREDFAGVLARIHAALKPGGALYASFKAGTAATGNTGGLDKLGRYYNYPDEGWLASMFAGTGQPRAPVWAHIAIEKVDGRDGETDWLHVLARRA